MKYIKDFADYIEYLCQQHPLLLHNNTTRRIFEVSTYDEAFGDFKTSAPEKNYFARLILPTMSISQDMDNAWKTYQFGLMVGKFYSNREDGKAGQMTAFKDSEKVADELIARMVMDSRNGHPLFGGTIDNPDNLNLQGDFFAFSGDGAYASTLYLFEFSTHRFIDTDCQTIVWGDGGLTPF